LGTPAVFDGDRGEVITNPKTQRAWTPNGWGTVKKGVRGIMVYGSNSFIVPDWSKTKKFNESVNEGKVDRVVGHSRYKYVGDGRKGKAIVSGPMKDREKEAIIKRAKKAGYVAKPNMGGGVTIHVESIEESMFSAIDQIRQDSKDVRDFVKNVFKDREFKKMSNDKDFIKYLKSIYEGTTNEDGHPQNWMSGRTSDYHTALRGKNKDYSGGTNFKKKNHGQPDVEEDDEDQETNHLSNKQTHIKSPLKMAESGKKKSDKNYKDWKSSRLRKEISKKLKEYGQRLDLSFIEDEEAKLDGTYPSTDAIDRDIDEKVDNYYLKNAKFRLKKVYKYLDIEYKTTRRGLKYVQINYIPVTKPQSQNPEFVNVGYEDEKDLQIIGKALKLKLKESVSEVAERDYKDEYKKFQSSKKSKKYRAELNKYNRDKGTYGNGDGKDASHKGGKIVGFESESKNRGRAEKSRLKKESVNEVGKGSNWAEKYVNDTNLYKKLNWYMKMGKGAEKKIKGKEFVIMSDGSALIWNTKTSDWELYKPKRIDKKTGKPTYESVNEGKVDRVVGHTKYKYVGDGRKGQAIVSGPMKDREKEAIIKRAKKAGYNAKPNMGGGVTIHVESLEVNEIGQFPINNYIQGIIPTGYLDTNTPQKKKQSVKLVSDLKKTLNTFWKQHDIPYRIK
jgi:hypothetical protein